MGWFTWFWDLIDTLSAYNWSAKQGRILFLGLDNAGKTTLLGKLATDQIHVHRPTQHPNTEDLTLEGIKIKTIDMGGHADARRLWRDYFTNVNGVVFIVDAAAPQRFEEAKRELDLLLQTDELATTPFVILGNKIDMPSAVNDEALKAGLGLSNLTTGKAKPPPNVRPLEVFMCSVVKKQGYGDGFRWLAQFLQAA